MALRNILLLVLALATASRSYALTNTQILDIVKGNPVNRCGAGCDKNQIKTAMNYLLFACRNAACKKDFVLRAVPFGTQSYIHQYCVIRETFHSSKWALRIQFDLVPAGARLVVVAVPVKSRTEPETFQRPYVHGPVFPRNKLYLLNRLVRNYCGITV